jgi:hypothetical protein
MAAIIYEHPCRFKGISLKNRSIVNSNFFKVVCHKNNMTHKKIRKLEKTLKSLVGNPTLMDKAIALLGKKRQPGIKNCEALLS